MTTNVSSLHVIFEVLKWTLSYEPVQKALFNNWLIFEAKLCSMKRMSTLYDMYINVKNEFVANDAAVCKLVNMVLAAGTVGRVNIPFGSGRNVIEPIIVG